MKKRLLKRPEPNLDESMIGYLLRLSDANCYESLSPILSLLDDNDCEVKAHKIRALCMGKLNIERLSHLTNKPQNTLNNLIFQSITLNKSQYFRVGHASISDELMNFRNPAICVQCLTESSYHRKIWTVASYIVCLKHLSLLQDTCSTCHSVFNWSRTNLLKCRCGAEIKAADSRQVESSETLLADMTAQAVTGHSIKGHPLIKDMQSFYAVIHLGYMLSSRYSWSNTELDLSSQIISNRHTEALNAFKPFANWPESFHQFLTEIVVINRAIYPAFSKPALLFRLSMALDRSPLRKLQPDIYQAVEYELENFIRSEQTPSILLKPKNQNLMQEKLLSKEETKNMLSVSDSSFARLIKINLKSPSSDEKYSLDNVTELRDILLRLVTLNEAAKILRLSLHNTKNLLKSGIITAFRGPDVDGYRDILIDTKVLNDLLTAIGNSVKPKSIHEVIPLSLYFKKYHYNSTHTFDELIHAALEGRLSIVNFDKENGLLGVSFSKDELLQLIDIKTKNKETNELLSINDVIVALNSYRDAIYRIMSAGLLKYQMATINIKSAQRFVSAEELDRFKTKYILPSEIAEIFQTNATNISERTMHLGIKPVSGPTIDNGLVYIFERKDIISINKQELDKLQSYKTRTGRPKKEQMTPKNKAKTDYMDAQTVAELLGDNANIQKVSRLVKKGFIQAVQHNGELGNKRYFKSEVVLQYLAEFRNNPHLIKLQDIPTWLSINKRRLEIDWLKSGRLSLINDGLGQRYAHVDDLENIKKLRISALSTQELAESTGKTRQDVNNAIRLGKIQPISGPNYDSFPNFLFDRTSITKLL
ncbi:hypothetical protein BEN74_07630 [Acinetobacter sp. WCHAc010034]|uniref:TniQ family protein n=1 Tax=Acinetobacter sp. WCHAc010034 TaxID=1879049 RepID=UPI000A39FFF0|nr:TniQ family protein [Acinetobacter sp. WCHAc010034]AYA02728.1 hypothetical protein BEN74_07630 [Acinetobacter sp. WCHAc010034]